MAYLYVVEYAFQAKDGFDAYKLPAGQEPAITTQKIAIGSGSVASSAFNAATRFVKVHADDICSVKFGPAPTATANDDRIPADGTNYYGVKPGDKIAVIENT